MGKSYTYIFCIIALLLLSSCSSRQMATINNSTEAEKVFTSWPLAEQYSYLYYGNENEPIAFLALNKNFTLTSRFWTPVNPNRKITPTNNTLWPPGFEFKGQEIISPDARSVGMVYTRYHWVTAWFVDSSTSRVIIPPPEPSPLQPNESKQWRDDN